MADDLKMADAQLDKKAYEAHRVACFANKHPALQQHTHHPQQDTSPIPHAPTLSTLLGAPHRAPTAAPQPDTSRIIIHIDADAFYAQCEEVRDPTLKSQPLGVTQKYLVVTCNYPARQCGITKLMGIAEARQKCPSLVLRSGEDLTPYRHASQRIHAVLQRFGPVERLGLDEFFLEATAAVQEALARGPAPDTWHGHLYSSQVALRQDSKHRPMDLRAAAQQVDVAAAPPEGPWTPALMAGSALAARVRSAIKEETGFRTAAGIACNKLLAKLVPRCPPTVSLVINAFLHRALPGVGFKLSGQLEQLGMRTVSDMRSWTRPQLVQRFGARIGRMLSTAAWGQDDSPVTPRGPPKSITVEDSFKSCDSTDAALRVLRVLLPDLWARLVEDAEEHCRWPGTLTLKWRRKGAGYHRSGASSGWPGGVHVGMDAGAAAHALARPCLALLAQHCPPPFDLTLLNVGATNFAPRTVGRLRGGPPSGQQGPVDGSAHTADALQAMRRDYSASTTTAHAVVSKRQERAMREGQHAPVGGDGALRSPLAERACSQEQLDDAAEEGDGFWDDLQQVECPVAAPAVSATATEAGAWAVQGSQRVVLHVDCDCFYVACERHDDPSLLGKPVAVEQFNSGGFVSVSYEARAHGVRCGDGVGAMGRASIPHLVSMQAVGVEEARRRCPGLVVKPMRTTRYREIANEVQQLLQHAAPGCPIEKASYDDYYIDATRLCSRLVLDPHPAASRDAMAAAPNVHVWGGSWDALCPAMLAGMRVALDIRRTLHDALGFTVSVGVARGRVGARLAGPLHKPSCVVAVPSAAHQQFLLSRSLLDIPSLGGKLGAQASAALKATLGRTDTSALLLQDMQHLPPQTLAAALTPPTASLVAALCSGCDDGAVQPRGPQASITCERSFSGMCTLSGVNGELQLLCADLLHRVLEDVDRHGRMPSKLVLSWRVDYEGVRSRSEECEGALVRQLRCCSEVGDEAAKQEALRALRVQAGSMARRHVPASACVTRLAIGVSYAKATPQPTLSSVLGKAADNHAAAGPSVMSLAAEAARLREVLPQLQAEGDDDLALAVRLQQEELSAAKQKPKRGGAKMKTLDSYWRPNDAKKSKHN